MPMMTGSILLLIMTSSVLSVSVTVLRGGRVDCCRPEESVTGGRVSMSEEPNNEKKISVDIVFIRLTSNDVTVVWSSGGEYVLWCRYGLGVECTVRTHSPPMMSL